MLDESLFHRVPASSTIPLGAKLARVDIGIPAPVFAEFLVRTDDPTTAMLAAMERKRALRVLPFDKRAAHECALLDRFALARATNAAGQASLGRKLKSLGRSLLLRA